MKYGNVFYIPHFNIIDKETYLVIDDETDDVDYPEQIELLNKKVGN